MSQESTANLRVPAINLESVFTHYVKIRDILSNWTGGTLEGAHLASLCQAIAKETGCVKRIETVIAALHGWWGKMLDESNYPVIAAWLAGNMYKIRLGQAPVAWSVSSPVEWMAGQIVDIQPCLHRFRFDDPAPVSSVRVVFRILCGSLSGTDLTVFWKRGMLTYSSIRMGFRRKSREFLRYHDPRQMFNLRCYLLLEPNKSDFPDRPPKIVSLRCTGTMLKYNRGLILDRARQQGSSSFRCPYGYSHACHRCLEGHDRCPVATHLDSYVLHYCVRCNSSQPFTADGHCVRCMNRQEM